MRTQTSRRLKLLVLVAATLPLLVAAFRWDPGTAIALLPILVACLGLARGGTWGAFLLLGSGTALALLAGGGAVHWSAGVVAASGLLVFAALVPLLWRYDALAAVLLAVISGGLGVAAAATLGATGEAQRSAPPATQPAAPRATEANRWTLDASSVASPVNLDDVNPPQLKLSSSSCWVDAVIKRSPWRLIAAEDGDSVTLQFGDLTVVGTRDGDTFEAVHHTRYVFTDGCTWETEQRFTGSVSARRLVYGYTENPLPGQCGCGCTCTASAVLTLE